MNTNNLNIDEENERMDNLTEGHPERSWIGIQETVARIKDPYEAEKHAVPWRQVSHLLNQVEVLLRASCSEKRDNDAPQTRTTQRPSTTIAPTGRPRTEKRSYAQVAGQGSGQKQVSVPKGNILPQREVKPIKARLSDKDETTRLRASNPRTHGPGRGTTMGQAISNFDGGTSDPPDGMDDGVSSNGPGTSSAPHRSRVDHSYKS